MSKQIQLRGGRKAWNDSFVGAPREVTVDTSQNALRIHDGVTPGGGATLYPAAAYARDFLNAASLDAARQGLGLAKVASSGLYSDIINEQRFLTAGTFTYTRSPGVTRGDVYLLGGCGGSGGYNPPAGLLVVSASGGTGAITIARNVTLPATATVVVGKGGAAGAATTDASAAGGAGGTSSFAGTYTALGGGGTGVAGTANSATTPVQSNPGEGGMPGTTGTENYRGLVGRFGFAVGGLTQFGLEVAILMRDITRVSGRGTAAYATPVTGFPGQDGAVIIVEYLNT